MAPVIFSGIQPTGRKHLGNYIGAIRQYVAGQDRGDPAIYCIVDLHATTVPYDPAELRERVYDTTAILLAAGLDPDRCILFRQGDVREHTELSWLLSSVTPVGELNRMHQFRDKSAAQRELVSAGLLFYPVLQAADVLAYRAHEVPVGEDQREHVELMRAPRSASTRASAKACSSCPSTGSPTSARASATSRSPSARCRRPAAPSRARSTCSTSPRRSCGSSSARSPTPAREIVRGADKPGVTNLIEILAAVRGVEPRDGRGAIADARGYGDLKVAVAEAVSGRARPGPRALRAIRDDEAALEDVLAAGAEKARAIASATLADVREAMGVGPARR